MHAFWLRQAARQSSRRRAASAAPSGTAHDRSVSGAPASISPGYSLSSLVHKRHPSHPPAPHAKQRVTPRQPTCPREQNGRHLVPISLPSSPSYRGREADCVTWAEPRPCLAILVPLQQRLVVSDLHEVRDHLSHGRAVQQLRGGGGKVNGRRRRRGWVR